MTGEVQIGGAPLGIDAIVAIARDGAPVVVSEPAWARVRRARAIIEAAAAADQPVYGVTTGLGGNVATRLSPADQRAFQDRVPRARACAVGERLPVDEVRAIMAVRLAGLATGGAGASPATLEALAAALNAGVHPVVPRIGSVGVGDLQALAHITLALMGEGEVHYQGETIDAAMALRKAGLSPLALDIKDGIAMVGINAQSVGQGALVVADGIQAIGAIACAAALQFEAFRASLSPFDPRVQAARPAPCTPDAAAELLRLLAGSGLHEPDPTRHVHDPLCYRSYAQVQGAARESLVRARALVQLELNNPGDNPLVLRDTGEILHNSNFDIVALALAFETLGQALAHVASAACWRSYKLMSPNFTDLPRFLSPRGTNRSGFATTQKTLAALDAEIRHRANPVSLGALPVADGQEDVAQMAPAVVAKTAEIIAHLRWIAAISLAVAAQAIDLGRRTGLGVGAAAVFERVRALAPALDEDRALAPDYQALEAAIRAGQFVPPRG